MGWKQKAKEWAPGNLTFLSTDGAAIRFIVIGEPILIEGVYNKKPNTRIACPVVTEDGFQLFVTGKRVFRKLASLEGLFKDHVFTIVRHGDEGDANATYPISYEKDEPTFKAWAKVGKKECTAAALKEATEAATDVCNQ